MMPKTLKGSSSMVKFKQSEGRQQVPQATRPQLPRDKTAGGRPIFASGELPKGGFQSMWRFNGAGDTKHSPTTKPGGKIY